MTFNECPGGILRLVQEDQRLILMKERRIFSANLIAFRGESITNLNGVRGGRHTTLRGFSFYKLKHQFVLRGNKATFNY